jgi:uncharacterized repeat protein (TIGR03803 family)
MACAQTTYSETVLHNFGSPPRGSVPVAGVIRDAAGNLYGTTAHGGAWNQGVVFKVNTAGHETVLYTFTGGTDGSNPYAGVIGDSAGNLYGTTLSGGAAGYGVVYKLNAAGQETVLYAFTGGSDGGNPYAGVIQDSSGNLYGTTEVGGGSNGGVVYSLDTTGNETVLYSFTGGNDGGYPYAGVVRDSAGNLYGTTYLGGTRDAGTVYKLGPAGHETVLYSFTGGADGEAPEAGVIRDSAGNLYGTTPYGGTADAGVVYQVSGVGGETVLYRFTGGVDGQWPFGGVIRDSAGNLYGTANGGGAADAGVVYELDAAGQETVLYSFTGGADGGSPWAGVIRDSAGNLYGTTSGGGASACGAVYELNTAGQQAVLFSFPSTVDGFYPEAGLVRDSAGNLYGTTSSGGTADAGVVYELTAKGQETVLYTFTGAADGGNPYAGLILDPAGNLYGTTYRGGTAGLGVVYKLDTAGNETVLHSFTGGTDGNNPIAGVIRDSAGNLYGTTPYGGAANAGVVFKLDATGQETVLYSFTGGADGNLPRAGVIRDSAGNLYGTTSYGGVGTASAGVVYKLDPTGHETVLYSFTDGADGGFPSAGVVGDSAGNLYGTADGGGPAASGVVYKLDAAGQETVLYSFTGGVDGGYPGTGVVLDSAGNLYGTTYLGGAADYGVVYKLDTGGQETVLHSFTGEADGSYPEAGVIVDSAGNLYGTTGIGGKRSSGVVFGLQLQ